MSCCPSDAEPARASAPSASGVTRYHHTTLYVAGPPTATVGVLAFPDIFGLDSGRAKQDADRLGELGYAIAFVDIGDGEYIDPDKERPDMVAWFKTRDFDAVLLPRIQDAITYLQKEAKVEQICSYGYCWGAWVGARLSAVEGPLVKGHVSFHPSWRVEQLLYGDGAIEQLTERVHVPQLLLSAENDQDIVKEHGAVQKILSSRESKISARSRVVDFPDVKHGWVNRGDLDDPVVKASVDKAWQLAREFIAQICSA
ncbi:hypothetical protein Poli38472_007941 [Pythium oligandrum]|uniref:Dienelactone hydrolase domain-containing protein n=1 Tax=Pythium oligandrum TaxID=41045 RepID=A0A8K1CLK6_PYTOL|nr:hypothetical protein Poli38472_007941 [Pythium oligandrum]|eukprot:TMW65299.1 hypothetical protein Poli38472_007941 [Pythium oligandrum]